VIDIQKIIRFLKERGIGVLITDHNVRETLGICDRAYIINAGEVLASGTPAEIVENESVRQVYLGEHFRSERTSDPNMKPSLQLKLSQHLTLTPQLQQSIKLLQLSTIELNQEIERILLENPMLEREDERRRREFARHAAADSPPPEREPNSAPNRGARAASSAKAARAAATTTASTGPMSAPSPRAAARTTTTRLPGHPGRQRFACASTSTSRSPCPRCPIATAPGALPDRGARRRRLPAPAAGRPAGSCCRRNTRSNSTTSPSPCTTCRTSSPTGIGARSPQECLALQLRTLPAEPHPHARARDRHPHLELLADRNFARLAGSPAATTTPARRPGPDLQPRPPPRLRYSPSETRYVLPDVIVRKLRGQVDGSLNHDAMPRLRINRLYASLLQQNRGRAADLSASCRRRAG
jgi:RNA polymerase sigma-54 factor